MQPVQCALQSRRIPLWPVRGAPDHQGEDTLNPNPYDFGLRVQHAELVTRTQQGAGKPSHGPAIGANELKLRGNGPFEPLPSRAAGEVGGAALEVGCETRVKGQYQILVAPEKDPSTINRASGAPSRGGQKAGDSVALCHRYGRRLKQPMTRAALPCLTL